MDTHSTPAQAPHADGSHAGDAHAGHDHPTWKTYVKVGVILTLITIAEVWAYYIPSFVASRAFVPSLLIMSAVKFVIVVMFYMHLKYDHKIFRVLFVGPVLIASLTLISLMFLFGHLGIRL